MQVQPINRSDEQRQRYKTYSGCNYIERRNRALHDLWFEVDDEILARSRWGVKRGAPSQDSNREDLEPRQLRLAQLAFMYCCKDTG